MVNRSICLQFLEHEANPFSTLNKTVLNHLSVLSRGAFARKTKPLGFSGAILRFCEGYMMSEGFTILMSNESSWRSSIVFSIKETAVDEALKVRAIHLCEFFSVTKGN